MNTKLYRGYTLVELLLVIAIIVLLVGIVYAAGGPAREKGRQSVCISNLHQIGQALSLYRSDYEGSEIGGTWAECGIPPSMYHLLPYMNNNQAILHCPDVNPDQIAFEFKRNMSGLWSNYHWNIFGKEDEIQLGTWADALSERGENFPIASCFDHNFPPVDRPTNNRFLIMLRLNGSVSAQYVPKFGTFWKW